MAIERTLSIIKPDAVAKNVIGEIYSRFEKAGLKIVASKMLRLDDELAGGFYAEHRERGFFRRSHCIHDVWARDGSSPRRRGRCSEES